MARGSLVQHVRETIYRYRMLAGGDTVVVGVSGGPDSTALLHVLAELRDALPLSMHVAHFDHRLRPDSPKDAAFVAAMSRALGLPHHEGAGETRRYAEQMHLSVEDGARRLRYEYLASVARAADAQAVATGHTLDDQAETVLMRLFRGSGLRGLGGIPPVRMLGSVRLVRPLLEVPRADIEAYLRARGLSWREDPTNRDPAILRNHIRMVVLPAIEGHNPSVRQTLARLAGLLRDEAAALDELAAPLIAEVLSGELDAVRIAREPFGRLPVALQRLALRSAVHRVRGNVDAIAFVHIEEARRLVLEGQVGAVVELPGGIRVARLSGAVEVTTQPAEGAGGPREYRLDVPGRVVAPEFGVYLVADVANASPQGVRSRINRADAEEIMIDEARAGPVLILRGPRPGDRFAPSGMGGRTKKLSDYLSDEKVPRHRRRFVPVLTTAEGEVLWIVGMRAAESARVGAEATRMVRIVARRLRA